MNTSKYRQLLQRLGSLVNPSTNSNAAWATTGIPSSYPSAAAGSSRAYSSRTGLDISLPSRRGFFADVPVVSNLLPNRKDLTARFSPHGIELVPKIIYSLTPNQIQTSVQQLGTVASSTALADRAASEVAERDGLGRPIMYAIGIKRWRKLKIKKHKIKKRRKANRHKSTNM